MNLNEDMRRVEEEIEGVRALLKDEVSELFDFDVVVGNVNYNANRNSVSLSVEPGPQADEQLSKRLGGVNVTTDGNMEIKCEFTTKATVTETT